MANYVNFPTGSPGPSPSIFRQGDVKIGIPTVGQTVQVVNYINGTGGRPAAGQMLPRDKV
jgi:hypothetical protein